jgi:hypothetical protein
VACFIKQEKHKTYFRKNMHILEKCDSFLGRRKDALEKNVAP